MKTEGKKQQKRVIKYISLLVLMCLLTFICATPVSATATNRTTSSAKKSNNSNEQDSTLVDEPDAFQLNISSNAGSSNLSASLQILLMLTVLSIAPSILIMVTSFTRIVIVLHFVRTALGLQTTPPNQVLIGLSLFLTFFIMSPVFSQINTDAIQPLSKGEITQEEAMEAGIKPLRTFMFKQTNTKDLKLFLEIADIPSEDLKNEEDIPTTTLIPAFIISEMRKAFVIGFVIYLPFIVIDMVVSSTLMSMGMMMLPPTTISLPFKILLFVLADGWNLIIGELVKTFY
ncbi:flagellar type III secretion system pore protein FliP [Velocimicrobium porci]|uniref:Flagellar biosynthetic protein FliP n=1 Tax=Velocimicrobium porci TaxID=2606634 RepID=A0A6L5XWK2_9FIRM|nr:flagellar type III secretion system pore protein FliP [Velocimicrobium porci]MSS62999.1 flagellar type III secretion system pore protein FliP [Velocimicrobium porci]